MFERISLEVDPLPAAARAARHQIVRHFELPAETVADLNIVVSELIANAVLHGIPPIQVTVTLDGVVLHVAVHDQDVQMGPKTPTSRGLGIVAHLAADWGVSRNDGGGKLVWAKLDARGRS